MSELLSAIVDQTFQDQRGRYYFLFDCAEYGDELKVLKFSIEERVSKPYKIKLQLTTREKVDPRRLNDRFARLTIIDKHQPDKRHYCGIVTKAVQKDKGFENGFTRFNVTVRPELAALKYIWNNRIYQNRTIPEIVGEVLKESGVTRFRWHLLEPHDQRDYVVQYKKTNLQFVERLLASEGISYRFDHEPDGVEMVMFDKSIETEKCAGAELLDYNSAAGAEVRGQSIKRFAWAEAIRSNVATYREQHFGNPEALYTQQWGSDAGNGQQRVLEKYTFPGYYKSDVAGERAARYEADSLQADASEGSGMGHAQFLAAGRRFKMTGHDEERYNEDYFLVAVSQQGRQPNVEEEFASDKDSTFLKTEFTCVRQYTPWRPKRPETQYTDGDHLATVAGPEGEEIHCDEFGRVKIFYNWDRRDRKDDSASCWVRVSQNWAGSQYGGMMIPRVGQSVIVTYINGDIEQPLVHGRIFNSVEQVPYKLPNAKTKMAIRSQTHKGNGFNELSFEDENGEEEVFIRAQKDMNTIILNNNSKNIYKNSAISIGKNAFKQVIGNNIDAVHGSKFTYVGLAADGAISALNMGNFLGGFRESISSLDSDFLNSALLGGYTIVVEGTKSESIGGSSIESVAGTKQLHASKGLFHTVGGSYNLSVAKHITYRVGSTFTLSVGDKLQLLCGDVSVSIDKDGSLEINGISCKFSFKEIIKLVAPKVNLN